MFGLVLTCMDVREEADKHHNNKRAQIGVCPLISEPDKESIAAATSRQEPVVDLETPDSEMIAIQVIVQQ